MVNPLLLTNNESQRRNTTRIYKLNRMWRKKHTTAPSSVVLGPLKIVPGSAITTNYIAQLIHPCGAHVCILYRTKMVKPCKGFESQGHVKKWPTVVAILMLTVRLVVEIIQR